MRANLFNMIDDFDSILPACDVNFHHYPNEAHINYTAQNQASEEGSDEEGEVEFLANSDTNLVKIEEDEEML